MNRLKYQSDPFETIAKDLIKNLDIIVLPADKNLGIVILDRNEYYEKLDQDVSNLNIYQPSGILIDDNDKEWLCDEEDYINNPKLRNDLIRRIYLEFIEILSEHYHDIDAAGFQYIEYLMSTFDIKIKFPRIYGLPKIHKIAANTQIDRNTRYSLQVG
jgi:hypothetical protein